MLRRESVGRRVRLRRAAGGVVVLLRRDSDNDCAFVAGAALLDTMHNAISRLR